MSKHVDPQTWVSLLQGQVELRLAQIAKLEDEVESLYEEIEQVQADMKRYTWPDDYVTGLNS